MNRVTRAPASAKVVEPDYAVNPGALDTKQTDGEQWYFEKILDHREMEDGTLELKIRWTEEWEDTWEPRDLIPEEAVSRYLAKAARKAKRAAERQAHQTSA